jgi:DNA-binding transcriptional MerR regulator
VSASTSHDASHLSIGEVLNILREEFPDVTISKIRFLESQGLTSRACAGSCTSRRRTSSRSR